MCANRSFKESLAASRAAKIGMSLTGCEKKRNVKEIYRTVILTKHLNFSFFSVLSPFYILLFTPTIVFFKFQFFYQSLSFVLFFLLLLLLFLPIPLALSSWVQLEKLCMLEEAPAYESFFTSINIPK